MCKWANDTDSYEVESNECVISDYKVSQMMLRGWVWVQEPDGLGEETPPKSLGFCHQAAEALTRWQHSEETVKDFCMFSVFFSLSCAAALIGVDYWHLILVCWWPTNFSFIGSSREETSYKSHQESTVGGGRKGGSLSHLARSLSLAPSLSLPLSPPLD